MGLRINCLIGQAYEAAIAAIKALFGLKKKGTKFFNLQGVKYAGLVGFQYFIYYFCSALQKTKV